MPAKALRGGEEDYPTHTPAKKAKMSITEGEAQGDEQDVKQKADPDRSMLEALANVLQSSCCLCHGKRSC